MTMDKTDIKALLSGLLDDELTEDERHAAERVLAESAQARALVEDAETVDELLSRYGAALGGEGDAAEQLPDGFEEEVLARTAWAQPPTPYWLRITTWTGWFAAAACLTLAVILLNTSGANRGDQPLLGSNTTGPHDERASAESSNPAGASAHEVRGRKRQVSNAGLVKVKPILATVTPSPSQLEGGMVLNTERMFSAMQQPQDEPTQPAANRSILPLSSPASLLPEANDDESADAAEQTSARFDVQPEDAETLFSVALLMDELAEADLQSFADVEHIRRVTEYEELLPRLADLDERVPLSARPAVMAAESILYRVMQGPLSQPDLESLRADVRQLELAERLEALSERPLDPRHSL